MKMSAPKRITWWVALALGVLGLIGTLVSIPVLTGLAFWLVLIGLALMLLACVTKGL